MTGPAPQLETTPGVRAMIKSLVFGAVLVDPDITIVDCNPAAETIFGQSLQRLRGRKLLDHLRIADRRIVEALEVGDAQLIARQLQVEISGHLQEINLTISPIADYPGWLALTISDTKDDELVDGPKEQASIKAPAVLAHEIKNPLAGIRGASQLLRRRIDPQHHELTDLIANEVDRVSALLDRMQKLGSEHVDEPEECNLHEAIHHAVRVLTSADGFGVNMMEEFDPSLPPVFVSRDALVQVLINLLANARDACSDQPDPRMTIRTRFVSGPMLSAIRLGRRTRLPIEVRITDNGPGIDPELRDHIFEPFVSSKPKGQGLGLALVAKLVREMDGRIGHERDANNGLTHFKLHLPLVPKETAA